MKKIAMETSIINDDYTKYIYETFDIQNTEKTTVQIEYELKNLDGMDWNIGVIIGNSGSGKTSVLKQIGEIKTVTFDEQKPLISNFAPLAPNQVTNILTAVGLSSVPTWLRPFKYLSNGEQYRATIAYLIAFAKEKEIILIDEFTSLVDRDVAKAMSYALQKYARRENKRIILASCHFDILEWIMPDWICNLQNGGAFELCEYLRRGRPQIELQAYRATHDSWEIFKKHHYLTELNNKAFAHYLFSWNGKIIGINIVYPMPSGTLQNAYRSSRLVVLPDFQGLGIGYNISKFMGSIYKSAGKRYYTKTVHPALGNKRNASSEWRPTPDNGKVRTERNIKSNYIEHWKENNRVSYCHEYIGPALSGYEHLLLSLDELRQENQNTLFED